MIEPSLVSVDLEEDIGVVSKSGGVVASLVEIGVVISESVWSLGSAVVVVGTKSVEPFFGSS